MNNDLTILPVVPEDQEINATQRELHPNIPDVYKGQLILLVGGVRMGKGTLWNNFLHNPNFYGGTEKEKNFFSSVSVISPTIWNDSTSRFTAKKWKDTCYDRYDDKIITDLIGMQKRKKDSGDEDTSYCLIVDDCYGEFNRHGRNGGAVLRLCSRFRHYVTKPHACLYLYSTQKYNDAVPIIRANATGLMVSGMIKNKKELESLKYDLDDTFGGQFDSIMERARVTPYSWIYFRLDSTPPEAFLNFTEKVF
jgi:hypothetical protein|tara:strand:+ start:33 stop:785 length:753 start_codon:yes stop_codon:yes gene_type:complete